MEKIKDLLKISSIPAFLAGLCCFSPLVLVFLGIGTVSLGASLANILYGDYRWLFRLLGLAALTIALIIYFRRKGICTIDQAIKKRNKIINIVIISLISAVILYIIWLYVILHYIGVFAGLWT